MSQVWDVPDRSKTFCQPISLECDVVKPVNWWYPAVVVVGAVAGFAVAGRSEPISGDRDLPLDMSVVSTSVPASGESTLIEEPAVTEAPPAPDVSATRVVLAVPSGTDAAALDEVVAALEAAGLPNVVTATAQVEVTASQVRVSEGFDEAASTVLQVLGLTAESVVLADDAAAAEVWSESDDQADVLVLLGPDVIG